MPGGRREAMQEVERGGIVRRERRRERGDDDGQEDQNTAGADRTPRARHRAAHVARGARSAATP